jgi:ATP-dependent Zn protease
MTPARTKRTEKFSEIGTAYHEAGHAVAAFFLGLWIGRRGVTIVPNKAKNTLGSAHVSKQLRENPDIDVSPRTFVRIEADAVVCLAGDLAQKKIDPRRRFGGQQDLHDAVSVLSYISSGSDEILSLRLKIAKLRARDLVDDRWQEIVAVAAALLDRKTLTREDVRQAIVRDGQQ